MAPANVMGISRHKLMSYQVLAPWGRIMLPHISVPNSVNYPNQTRIDSPSPLDAWSLDALYRIL